MNLLRFAAEHKKELDVLSNDRAMFLVSLVSELKTTTIRDLAHHLDWPPGEVKRLWAKVVDAGFGSKEAIFGGVEEPLELSASARDMLAAVGLSSPTDFQDSSSVAFDPLWRAF